MDIQFGMRGFLWLLLTTLWFILNTNALRSNLYLDELCESGKNNLNLRFSPKNPESVSAVTLRLSQDQYPLGLDCLLNVVPVFPQTSIALELVEVNLRGDSTNCFDVLSVESSSHTMQLCHQQFLPNESKSWSLDADGPIQLGFKSNTSIGDSDTTDLGFTINLIIFFKTNDLNTCKLEDGFLCSDSDHCIPWNLLCDGQEDCADGKDELAPSCTTALEEEEKDANQMKQRSNILFSVLLITMLIAFVGSCSYVICYRLRHLVELQRAREMGGSQSHGVFFIPTAFRRPGQRTTHESRTHLNQLDIIPQERTTYPRPYDSPPPPYESILRRTEPTPNKTQAPSTTTQAV